MHILVRTVFSKLYTLDPKEEEAKLLAGNDDEAAEIELRMSVSTKDEKLPSEEDSSAEAEVEQGKQEKEIPEPEKEQEKEDVPPTPMSPTNRPECMSILISNKFTKFTIYRWPSFDT